MPPGAMMRRVVYREFGPPSVLQLEEGVPQPNRRVDELLVEIAATSVNPVDLKSRAGELPRFLATLPKVPGGDVAGVVVDSEVHIGKFKPGTRVAFLSDGYRWDKPYGSYAEFITVPEAHAAILPDSIGFGQAAGLPLVALTALQAFEPLNLKPGQRVLIHAGAGGVGSAAIQIAKARCLHVTTTCSTRNLDFVKELGADVAIDYTKQQFEEVCKEEPFDCVLDLVAGDYEWRSKRVIKRGGTYISVLAKGSMLAMIKGKLAALLGLGPRYHVVMVKPSGEQMEAVLKLVQEGKLRPIVDKVFPLEQAKEAHEYVEKGHTRGKVILTVKEET